MIAAGNVESQYDHDLHGRERNGHGNAGDVRDYAERGTRASAAENDDLWGEMPQGSCTGGLTGAPEGRVPQDADDARLGYDVHGVLENGSVGVYEMFRDYESADDCVCVVAMNEVPVHET